MGRVLRRVLYVLYTYLAGVHGSLSPAPLSLVSSPTIYVPTLYKIKLRMDTMTPYPLVRRPFLEARVVSGHHVIC
ncbi:hypothetical protein GGR54DRAFT_624327 [Hypoxylon sp. NC1633]|nr:hypothetical protein GGR54DRAFT_624327 [Hypoxylon sp. NC1633]